MQEKIHISDLKTLNKKLEKFKKDNFHVVSDFDRTLTKAVIEGNKTHTFYELVRQSNYLSPDYTKKSYALFDKYRPIEISPEISLKEKSEKMHEWWSLHWKLMIESGLDLDIIKKIIHDNKVVLRKGADLFLDTLNKNNIPLLIFSSAIGNAIEEFLKYKEMLTKNIHIIANFMIFDKKGKATGYKTPIIHTFNKNEIVLKDLPYFNEVKDKKNVLLLGDTLGDLGMSKGLDHDQIIRIGFLNQNIEENLEKFSEFFDVVILNDGPMDYINELLKKIIS